MIEGFQPIPRRSYARWFVRHGARTDYDHGFLSKDQARDWIDSHTARIEWRCGFVFRAKGQSVDTEIVDRAGRRAKV